MKRKVILVVASVVLIAGLVLAGFGCAPSPAEGKTLKIGMIEALNWPLGVDAVNLVDLDIERGNEDGGLLIGGERYKLELIVDDNKMDLALAKTAAEKQIFDDGVKFIVGDHCCMSYLDLADENKVVVVGHPVTPELFDPKYHYLFSGNLDMTSWVSSIHWLAEQFPDKETIVFPLPDNLSGHSYGPVWEAAAESAGLTVLEIIYYPYPSTDLSAVGTRVKTLNPDFLSLIGGGPEMDSLIIKAAYVAGWKGQLFGTSTIPARVFMGIAGIEATEGLAGLAWPAEFEPALTNMAKEVKADWIAEYGEWTDPEEVFTNQWWVLKAALQEASSPDPDEVADIIASGFEFECPTGAGMMVSRPDYGNPRSVQLILENFVKQIEGGEVKLIDRMTPQEIYDYLKIIYGW